MSVSSSIQKGDFDLNVVSLRKPLEFADGTIQSTAYTGAGGVPTLEEVLLAGDDAQGNDILGVNDLEVNNQIQLTPAGNVVNFLGEINQIAGGLGFNGNQLQPTLVSSNAGQGVGIGLIVADNTLGDGFYILPNANDNLYNPIVQAGDIAMVAQSASQSLSIVPDSATTCGLRITDTSVLIGAGGAVDTPTQNIIFNNPANRITATVTGGMVVQSSTIEPTPTLSTLDVPTGQSTYFIPKANAGNYNPTCQANSQQIVAFGTAGVGTQALEIVPHSTTSCGVKVAPTFCEIGAGGGGADPTNRINFSGAGTLEYGSSHQFVNGVAQYSPAGNASGIIPSTPSLFANVAPSFEILTFQLTGNSATPSATMTLQHNITGTTNYSVFPSIYYGFSGSSGTYNATGTSGAIQQIVISGITSTQFNWVLSKATSDNVNIFLQFLVVYQMAGTNYPKAY